MSGCEKSGVLISGSSSITIYDSRLHGHFLCIYSSISFQFRNIFLGKMIQKVGEFGMVKIGLRSY
jgi:hypothetical protein